MVVLSKSKNHGVIVQNTYFSTEITIMMSKKWKTSLFWPKNRFLAKNSVFSPGLSKCHCPSFLLFLDVVLRTCKDSKNKNIEILRTCKDNDNQNHRGQSVHFVLLYFCPSLIKGQFSLWKCIEIVRSLFFWFILSVLKVRKLRWYNIELEKHSFIFKMCKKVKFYYQLIFKVSKRTIRINFDLSFGVLCPLALILRTCKDKQIGYYEILRTCKDRHYWKFRRKDKCPYTSNTSLGQACIPPELENRKKVWKSYGRCRSSSPPRVNKRNVFIKNPLRWIFSFQFLAKRKKQS